MSSTIYNSIPVENVQNKKFVSSKLWTVTQDTTSSLDVNVGTVRSPYDEGFIQGKIPLGTSTLTVKYNSDGFIPEVMYYNFQRYIEKNNLGSILVPGISGSYLSVPQNIIGDGIKETSITLIDASSGSVTIKDKKGLLYDSGIDSSSFMPENSLVYYLTVNEYTSSVDSVYESTTHNYITASVVEGVFVGEHEIGKSFGFDAVSNYIKITHNQIISPRADQDYTLSMMMVIPTSQTGAGDYSTLAAKRDNNQPDFPFEISLGDNVNSNKVVYEISSGIENNVLTSSALSAGQHHVAISKSGSVLTLYADQVIQDQVTINTSSFGYATNTSDIYFGASDATVRNPFTGSLSEIRYYTHGASITELSALGKTLTSDWSFLQHSYIGTVDYQMGILNVNSLNPSYKNVFLGDGDKNYTDKSFTLTFRNLHPIHEYKVKCEVKGSSGNMSMNPTFMPNENVPNKDFTPYVSSIGLYDKEYNLLAIGKLSTAFKKLPEIGFNLSVQIDF